MRGRSKAKRVVALDWDDHTLRVVHAHLTKRGVTIDRLLSAALPSGLDASNPHQMGVHIRQTLAQEGITTKHAVVDIPRDQAILKTLTLPVSQPDELPGMVEIQIAKELPFPAKEAVIDFAFDPKETQQVTGDVLVAAIRHELLEQYETTCAAAGLRLERVGLRPYANKVSACALLQHAVPERVLFIDVRPTFMEIDVLRKGILSFSRSASVVIPHGAGQSQVLSITRPDDSAGGAERADAGASTEPQPTGDRVIHSLLLEVTRSIEAYRASDPGAMIDHVVIAGDVGVEEALSEAIQRRLDLTVEIYNPAAVFGWEPDEGAGAAAFAASLGLVLGHAQSGDGHFDFLHPKKTVSAAKERLKKAPMVAAVVVVFVAAAAVSLGYYTKPSRDRLADLQHQIKELEAKAKENRQFLKLVEEIRAFDQDQLVWVDELYDVFSTLPPNDEMLITSVDMDQDEREIKLKTKCKNSDTPNEAVRRIAEFRRAGREKPRYMAIGGTKNEKSSESYPFSQALTVTVLNDSEGIKKAGKP